MSDQDSKLAFDAAAAIFESWRGRCLDTFARGESAIGKTLEAARDAGKDVRLDHLAGQRWKQLYNVSDAEASTERQRGALLDALTEWQALDTDRSYLAHGVMTVLRDRKGCNYLLQRMVVYKSNKREGRERVLTDEDANEFEERLKKAYAALTRELGGLRKRIA